MSYVPTWVFIAQSQHFKYYWGVIIEVSDEEMLAIRSMD